MIKKVLTIAGSDSTAGGGLQADLKTFEEFGVFGFSSLTTIVTMDPEKGWSHEITELDSALLRKQLVSVFAGGAVDSLKTGMMGSVANIEVASEFMANYHMKNIVIDPVIACKGTTELLQPETVDKMKELLIPKALITTPNLIEAGILSGLGDLKSVEAIKAAAKKIYALGAKNVVIKGGHRLGTAKAIDVFYDGHDFDILENELYQTDFNHGAGCTFAAAITASIAKGASVKESVYLAKHFVAAGIKNGVSVNPYVGHVWHGAYNKAESRILPDTTEA
jgi:pyridoxine kinase